MVESQTDFPPPSYMVESQTELSIDVMADIVGQGYSRLPVYEGHPHNIRGFLMVKNLIVLNPRDNRKISTLGLRKPLVVGLEHPLLDLLTEFQKGASHMAIVSDRPEKVGRRRTAGLYMSASACWKRKTTEKLL